MLNGIDTEIDKRELVIGMIKGAFWGCVTLTAFAASIYYLNRMDFISMGGEIATTFLIGGLGAMGGAAIGAVNQTAHIPAQVVRNVKDNCVDGVCKLADRVLPEAKKKVEHKSKKEAEKQLDEQPAAASRSAADRASNGTVINNYFQGPVSKVYATDYSRHKDAKKNESDSCARTRGYSPSRKSSTKQ